MTITLYTFTDKGDEESCDHSYSTTDAMRAREYAKSTGAQTWANEMEYTDRKPVEWEYLVNSQSSQTKKDMNNLKKYTEGGGDDISAENQRIVEQLVNREVGHCVSNLFVTLARYCNDADNDINDEAVRALQFMPADFEEEGRQCGWIPTSECKGQFFNTVAKSYSKAGDWDELCSEQGISTPEGKDKEFCAWLEGWVILDLNDSVFCFTREEGRRTINNHLVGRACRR